jgi:NAD-dependent deacetylase
VTPFVQTVEPAECAELIRSASSAVALTGAGISTEAGIPDFRGPGGLYESGKYDPELVFSITHFQQHPQLFYQFTREFMATARHIRPTFTHRLLAVLEQQALLSGVITQNIDALHHQAGSRRIRELHGSYWSASCINCDGYAMVGTSWRWWEDAMRSSPRSPVVSCPSCGGIVKPNVVFFGEAVRDFDEALEMVGGSDLLLVVGSSLSVYPAAYLPHYAKGRVVVVNRGEVRLEPGRNRYFCQSGIDSFFRSVAVHLGIRLDDGPEALKGVV